MPEVKRLFLKDEIIELKKLLLQTNIFKKHYPNYERWIDNTTNECITGRRLAFGIVTAEMKNGKPHKNVIGGCILKMTEGDIVELKSLYITEKERKRGLGKMLFEHIEEHCIKRGYREIITDVPCIQDKTFWFLAKQGYIIYGRADRYKVGDPCYSMFKKLTPYYTGDPFDWEALSNWFLINIYNVSTKERMRDSDRQEVLLKWEIEPIKEGGSSRDIFTKGLALISEEFPPEDIIKKFKAETAQIGAHVPLIFARSVSEERHKIAKDLNIILIDERRIAELTKYTPNKFSKNDIAGMIVEIKPDYFKRIEDEWDDFVYFKGAPIGKYLKPGHKLYFYVGPTSKYPKGFIGGFGDISKIEINSPEDLWERYEKKNKIFKDKEEYKTFTEYKKNLLGIVICDFEKLEDSIDFSELRKIIDKDLETEDLGHFYLDNGIIKGFYDKIQKEKIKKKKEKTSEERNKDKTREKILHHLMKFKQNVEKNNRQAFWIGDKLQSKPEEIGRSQLTSFITGLGAKEIFMEVRDGKGKSDVIFITEDGDKQLIETKIWHNRKYVMVDGLKKLRGYMIAETLNKAYYIVFTPNKPEKVQDTHQEISLEDEKTVYVIFIDISKNQQTW